MSTIPWLGEVSYPTIAAKRAYEIVLGKMLQTGPSTPADVEVPYLKSASIQWDGVRADPHVRMWASPTEARDLEVRPGDLLICEGGDVGRAAIYSGPPCYIFQNSVHRARTRNGFDIRYFRYVLSALHGSDWLDVLCNKATIRHLTGDKLGALEIPLPPPPEEQRRIADFLDLQTARIDAVERTRSTQIELLAEFERSILDDIFRSSKSRTTTRLKRLLAVRPRYGVLVPQFVDDGVPFIRVNDLEDLEERADQLRTIPAELSAQYPRTVVQPRDLLVSVVGTLGRAAIAPGSLVGANIARAVCSIRVAPDIAAELVLAWFKTSAFQRQALVATSTDTAQPTLNAT